MIVIKSYLDINSKKVVTGKYFEVQKGNRKATYKVIESENFEGCYELLRCDLSKNMCGGIIRSEKRLTGCGSIKGCVQLAYDIT